MYPRGTPSATSGENQRFIPRKLHFVDLNVTPKHKKIKGCHAELDPEKQRGEANSLSTIWRMRLPPVSAHSASTRHPLLPRCPSGSEASLHTPATYYGFVLLQNLPPSSPLLRCLQTGCAMPSHCPLLLPLANSEKRLSFFCPCTVLSKRILVHGRRRNSSIQGKGN